MGAPIDEYPGQNGAVESYSDRFELISPNDGADLPRIYKAIVCGGTGGAVVCQDRDGTQVTAFAVAGMPLQGIRPKRILATGTVATPLIGIK